MHTTSSDIHVLSLHDALPIFAKLDIASGDLVTEIGTIVEHNLVDRLGARPGQLQPTTSTTGSGRPLFGRITRVPANHDRKSTRLNSSNMAISYAVCCFKEQRH